MKKNRKHFHINIDMVIVFIIIILVMVLLGFINHEEKRLFELSLDPLNMYPNQHDIINEDLSREIAKFRDGACRMIEIYDEEYQLLARYEFDHVHDHSNENDLTIYDDLIDILKNNPTGYTTVELQDGTLENVYFWWSRMTTGERRVVFLYTNLGKEYDMFYIRLICYIIVAMVFLLLIRLKFMQERYHIEVYSNIATDIQKSLCKQKNL